MNKITRIVFLFCLLISFQRNVFAQYTSAGLNTTALGYVTSDAGLYQGFNVAHYGLGWYNDPDYNWAGPTLYVSSWGGLKFFTGGSPKLFINYSGNIGIGTSSPNSAIQIGSINSSSTNKTLDIPGTYNFEQVNLRNGANGNGELEFVTHQTTTTSGGVKFYNTDGANLALQTAPLTTGYVNLNYTTKAVFNNDGTIGFNTTSIPSGYLFAINGKAIANSITVKPYPWADYVFDKDYKLPDLNLLEKFIKANHHLPEIPNTKEVEKDGIDLGANQTLLLKKIEELTLIIIEQNKRLNDQDSAIKSLANKYSIRQ